MVARHAVMETVSFNLGKYGLGMPRTVWRILSNHPDGEMFALTALVGALIFFYLFWILLRTKLVFPTARNWAVLSGAGLLVFWLAYAPFAVNVVSDFATTGSGNRVAMAAALGTAMLQVGSLGWLTSYLKTDALRRAVFCFALTLACVSGFVVNGALASYWVAASRTQQAILSDIRERFRVLPSGTTLILDGVCPYIGPGIVFEEDWDMTGALQLLYHDNSLRGNIVTPTMKLEPQYLSLSGYEENRYSYQNNLIVYNYKSKVIAALRDAQSARRYFEIYNPRQNRNCGYSLPGEGVALF